MTPLGQLLMTGGALSCRGNLSNQAATTSAGSRRPGRGLTRVIASAILLTAPDNPLGRRVTPSATFLPVIRLVIIGAQVELDEKRMHLLSAPADRTPVFFHLMTSLH